MSATRSSLLCAALAAAALAGPSAPRAGAIPLPAAFAAADAAAGRSDLYREGQRALAEERYADAATLYARLAAEKGEEADAALYWKAYAESRAARRSEALATIRQLLASYPESAWADDAAALEIELRSPARAPRPPLPPGRPAPATPAVAPVAPVPAVLPVPGTPAVPPPPGRRGGEPELSESDELKLYALDGLLQAEPEKAIPVLERFLAGDQPLRLKQRALFVLSQSDSPRAREILLRTVREGRPEELRVEAVRTLGMAGESADLAALASLFTSDAPRAVREAVLDAYMMSDQTAPLAAAARSDRDPEIRARAIDMLGAMEASAELRSLYETEKDPQLRIKLLQAFGIADDVEGLIRAARAETDPRVQAAAIEGLAIAGSSGAATRALMDIYRGAADPETKQRVLEALMIQEQARALIELFRTEKDPALKRVIVQQLGMLDSDEAAQVLLEVLEGKP